VYKIQLLVFLFLSNVEAFCIHVFSSLLLLPFQMVNSLQRKSSKPLLLKILKHMVRPITVPIIPVIIEIIIR